MLGSDAESEAAADCADRGLRVGADRQVVGEAPDLIAGLGAQPSLLQLGLQVVLELCAHGARGTAYPQVLGDLGEIPLVGRRNGHLPALDPTPGNVLTGP